MAATGRDQQIAPSQVEATLHRPGALWPVTEVWHGHDSASRGLRTVHGALAGLDPRSYFGQSAQLLFLPDMPKLAAYFAFSSSQRTEQTKKMQQLLKSSQDLRNLEQQLSDYEQKLTESDKQLEVCCSRRIKDLAFTGESSRLFFSLSLYFTSLV